MHHSSSENSSVSPFDILPGLVWRSGPDGTCTFFNKRWLAFTGHTREEERENGWASIVHPEDFAPRDKIFQTCLATRQPFRCEFRLRRKDGSYQRVAEEATPVFDATEEFVGLLGCCLTISEPKRDTEKTRAPKETKKTASAGKFRAGPEGQCHYVDQWWTQLTGMDPEDALGGGWLRALHPDDLKATREQIAECFGKQEHFDVVTRIVDKEGETVEIRFQCQPKFDEGGILTGYEGTVSHLSAGMKSPAAESADDTEEPARDNYESLSVLAGGIAHDFNNLLTPIVLNLNVVRSQLHQPQYVNEVRERLHETESAALRAKSLTQRLLSFAEGGKVEKKTVNLISSIEETARFLLNAGNDRFELTIPKDLWPVVADPCKINEALIALIKNAQEATAGGGSIRVTAMNLEDARRPDLPSLSGRHVCIQVEDDGTGIDPESQGKIFDPYFSTKSEGTGLGLPSAMSIVRSHSGRLVVDSALGRGTTFSIYLPATSADAAEPEKPGKTSPPATGEAQSRTTPGRVLIMDDEALVLSSISAMLRSYGYEVETAVNGDEALEAYTEARKVNQPIDLTLMDLTIPGGMGGKEAIGKLIEIDPQAKAVLCSGYSNDPIMDKFEDYGFKAAIQKPFHPEKLNSLILDIIAA